MQDDSIPLKLADRRRCKLQRGTGGGADRGATGGSGAMGDGAGSGEAARGPPGGLVGRRQPALARRPGAKAAASSSGSAGQLQWGIDQPA